MNQGDGNESESFSVCVASWASPLISDVLFTHVTPNLWLQRDLLACRLCCSVWRRAFPLSRVFLSSSRVSEALNRPNVINQALELYFTDPPAEIRSLIANCHRLESVSLSLDERQKSHFGAMCDLLELNLPHLKRLSVPSLSEVPQSIAVRFADAIKGTTSPLTSLDFRNTGPALAAAVLPVLTHCTKLESLCISGMTLESQDDLIKLIKFTTSIKRLEILVDFEIEIFGSDAFEAFISALTTNSTITSLFIDFSNIHIDLSRFGEVLKMNRTLESLNLLCASCFANQQFLSLIENLERNQTLRDLWISDVEFAEGAAEALGRCFQRNTSLRSLYLEISSDVFDFQPMFQGLLSNTSLTSLSFAKMPQIFLEQFSDWILQNGPTGRIALQIVKFRWKDIGDVVDSLLKNLIKLDNLTELDLSCCWAYTDSKYFESYATLIEGSSSLTSLRMHPCSVDSAALNRICGALQRNTRITELEIPGSGRPVSESTEELCQMIESHPSLRRLCLTVLQPSLSSDTRLLSAVMRSQNITEFLVQPKGHNQNVEQLDLCKTFPPSC